MLKIRESININATVNEVYNFFTHLKENYMTMHPDHELINMPESLIEDSVIRTKETINDLSLNYRLHVLKIIPQKMIIYSIPFIGKGAFILEETEKGMKLTEEIHIGIHAPIIGKIIDKLITLTSPNLINSVTKHFDAELINVKKTLEGDTVSMSTY